MMREDCCYAIVANFVRIVYSGKGIGSAIHTGSMGGLSSFATAAMAGG